MPHSQHYNKRMRERAARLKAEGKCVDSCGRMARPGKTRCQECADKQMVSRRALTRRLDAARHASHRYYIAHKERVSRSRAKKYQELLQHKAELLHQQQLAAGFTDGDPEVIGH